MIGDPLMAATGFGELKIFSGSAHPELAKEIASFLGVQPGQARLRRFPDTEVSFQIDENIRAQISSSMVQKWWARPRPSGRCGGVIINWTSP